MTMHRPQAFRGDPVTIYNQYLDEKGAILPALSIWQPWAWLIANGYKDIENRTWWTKFRGPFLIHASKRMDCTATAISQTGNG